MRYVVTGVSGGIGQALAEQLLARGDEVIGLDVAAPVLDLHGFHQVDLADRGAIDAVVAGIDGQIDGLCNVAGLAPRPGREEAVLAVNAFAPRWLTAAVLPRLAEGASVVTLASRAGQFWRDNLDENRALLTAPDAAHFLAGHPVDATRAYCLSKEAMILWTLAESEAMARRGFRINTVSPAAVGTGILDDFKTAFGARVAANETRAGRVAEPSEAAAAAAFLLSPASSWIKGIDLWVDGGQAAYMTSDALALGDMRCLM